MFTKDCNSNDSSSACCQQGNVPYCDVLGSSGVHDDPSSKFAPQPSLGVPLRSKSFLVFQKFVCDRCDVGYIFQVLASDDDTARRGCKMSFCVFYKLAINCIQSTIMKILVPSARLILHSTKLCTKLKVFKKKKIGTKVTSEAFLSISQNLKATRLQGGTQTKL